MADTVIQIRDTDPNNPGQKIGRLLVDTGLTDPSTGHLLFVPGTAIVSGGASDALTTCVPPSTVEVAINNYSEVDAGLLATIQATDPNAEFKQVTAGQLADFNDDGEADIAADPSSGGSFDGRVFRVVQANLDFTIADCLLDADTIDLGVTVTLTRTADTPPTSGGDGGINISNTDTDALLQSTVIMGGADGNLSETVTLGLTKADLLSGNIALVLSLQTQDGVLPATNGVNWTGISIAVSVSTSAVCAPQPALRTKGCQDDAIVENLQAIATSSSASSLPLDAFGNVAVSNLTARVALAFNYNINTELAVTDASGTGSVSHSGQFAVLSTGASVSSDATLSSIRVIDYYPGTGAKAVFTGTFDAGAEGSEQWIGVGDYDADGFFFVRKDLEFGIDRVSGGVHHFVPQTDWNRDKADGLGVLPLMSTWELGNVFQVRYQWLGFGAIKFYVENPSNGAFILVHLVEYANTATVTSVNNPSFPLHAGVRNTTNAADIVLQVPSMGGYLEGEHFDTGPLFSTDNQKTGVGSTFTNIFTVRSKTTYQGVVNRIHATALELSADSDGTKAVTVKLIKNATLGGVPSYADVSTNTSVMEVDTAGTTVTGGTALKTFRLSKNESKDIDISSLDIEFLAGNTLTVAMATDSGTSDCGAAFTWRESL